jgi:hypothetical protein
MAVGHCRSDPNLEAFQDHGAANFATLTRADDGGSNRTRTCDPLLVSYRRRVRCCTPVFGGIVKGVFWPMSAGEGRIRLGLAGGWLVV